MPPESSFDEAVSSSSSTSTRHEVFVPGRLCLLGEHSDWVRLSSLHLCFILFCFRGNFSTRIATNFSFSLFLSSPSFTKGGRVPPKSSIVETRFVPRRWHDRRHIRDDARARERENNSDSNEDGFRRDERGRVGNRRRHRRYFIAHRERRGILVVHRRND